MIELIEAAVISYMGKYYFKSLIIGFPSTENIPEDKILILSSESGNYTPISHKRWNLIKKFTKEGCIIKRSLPSNVILRRKIKLSLEEVINLGKFYSNDFSEIVDRLREIDK